MRTKSFSNWLVALAAAASMCITQRGWAQQCPTGTVDSDPAMSSLLPSLDQAFAVGANNPCGSLFGAPPPAGLQQIAKVGGPGARVTTLPVVFSNGKGAVRMPLFRVQSADGTVRYVEPGGRTYQSFAAWQKENKLPPGQVTFPSSGDIGGPGCAAPLSTLDTPSNSLGSKIGRGLDIAAGVAMVGVAVAATVGTGGIAPAVVGLGVAAYAGVRSVLRLSDKVSHQETINPIKSAEARGDELSLAMTVVGLGAAGSAVAGANGLARGLGAASIGLGAASTVDLGYQTATNWKNLSAAQRGLAVSQLMFYGALTAIGAKQAIRPAVPVVGTAENPADVVIVGAGISGLTAAKQISAAGRTIRVVEAADHIGGRMVTNEKTFSVPIDEGAAWLHGDEATGNPYKQVVDDLGLHRNGPTNGIIDEGVLWVNGKKATPEQVAEFEQAQEEAENRLSETVAAGNDAPVSDALPKGRWAGVVESNMARLEAAVEAKQSSSKDSVEFQSGHDELVQEGLGTSAAKFGKDVPVQLKTPVKKVTWNKGLVTLETATGEKIVGKKVLLTVSTGILSDPTKIAFDPPLPQWKQDAIAGLPMGLMNKVVLEFKSDIFNREGDTMKPDTWVVAAEGNPDNLQEPMGFLLKPFKANIAVGFVGGDIARGLEGKPDSEVIALALSKLRARYGDAVDRQFSKGAVTHWGQSGPGDQGEWTKGSYSAAMPGQTGMHDQLFKPIDGTVFFAGEATSPTKWNGSVPGAYDSGLRASQGLLEQLTADEGQPPIHLHYHP